MTLRRDFMACLASTVLAMPWPAKAQTTRMKRIGVLVPYAETDAESQMHLSAFREALKQSGWSAGNNLQLDIHWAASDEPGRLEKAARELVASQPDAILVRSTAATAMLLKHTRVIPLVFVVVSDPVGDGFVASLARPGGNATGFTNVESSLGGKWLQLLKEADPRVTRVAVLFGAKTAAGGGAYYLRLIKEATTSIPVRVDPMAIEDGAGLERAVAEFVGKPGGGLLVLPDATTTAQRERIVVLAARHRLPAVYPFELFARNGGLISYGIDITDQYRRAAAYLDRMLRGEPPAMLPVQAPTRFELVVNLRTANTLGIKLPQSVLLQATAVIE